MASRQSWDNLPDDVRAAVRAWTQQRETAIPLVVAAMTALGRVACPDVERNDAGQRCGTYLDDPADAGLFLGTALLHTDWHHTDWHHTNVLITGADTARLIDWRLAHPRHRLDRSGVLGTADDHPDAWTHRLSDAAAQWAAYRKGT